MLTPLIHCRVFVPLLKYVITEVLPPSLTGLAFASGGSVLVPAGIGSIRKRGSFQQLLTEATLVAPPATQTHYNSQVLEREKRKTKIRSRGKLPVGSCMALTKAAGIFVKNSQFIAR